MYISAGASNAPDGIKVIAEIMASLDSMEPNMLPLCRSPDGPVEPVGPLGGCSGWP